MIYVMTFVCSFFWGVLQSVNEGRCQKIVLSASISNRGWDLVPSMTQFWIMTLEWHDSAQTGLKHRVENTGTSHSLFLKCAPTCAV